MYSQQIRGVNHTFPTLIEVLAKASPPRSGDELAGCAAESDRERAAAQWVLADIPLTDFLNDVPIPYEEDEITRPIIDGHDAAAFEPVSHLTVGGLRDWLLDTAARDDGDTELSALAPGLTPEMVAAVSKLMRNQDLIAVSHAVAHTSAFRTTIGLPGRLSTRLQPNHPTDDPRGVAAAVLDGLLLGCGDAVIGVNPVSDSPPRHTADLLHLLDEIRERYRIPTRSRCAECSSSEPTTPMRETPSTRPSTSPRCAPTWPRQVWERRPCCTAGYGIGRSTCVVPTWDVFPPHSIH